MYVASIRLSMHFVRTVPVIELEYAAIAESTSDNFTLTTVRQWDYTARTGEKQNTLNPYGWILRLFCFLFLFLLVIKPNASWIVEWSMRPCARKCQLRTQYLVHVLDKRLVEWMYTYRGRLIPFASQRRLALSKDDITHATHCTGHVVYWKGGPTQPCLCLHLIPEIEDCGAIVVAMRETSMNKQGILSACSTPEPQGELIFCIIIHIFWNPLSFTILSTEYIRKLMV